MKTELMNKIEEKEYKIELEIIDKRLSNDLKHRKGMSVSNLKYMSQFASSFALEEISQQPVGQIPWRFLIEVMSKCKTKESRLWYIKKTYENSWSRSILIKQIKAKAYKKIQ